MAGSYDGSIRIDTSINSQPIDNGISAIENKIKSIGTTIGLAFGVKELIDFGKRAVTAASDLAEAQNVVDTAFGDMSWKMEQFAATALETYGISELTAKNMGSTYMAMAKGMGVATDYLVGRSNARTQAPKLKSICDYVGLSDRSVNMLAGLKKENPKKSAMINLLLEQAADDITDDYEFDGEYEGSVLNALCRYLCKYSSLDEYVAEMTSSSDEGITSAIRGAVYQMILNQAVDAIKKLQHSQFDMIWDKKLRG